MNKDLEDMSLEEFLDWWENDKEKKRINDKYEIKFEGTWYDEAPIHCDGCGNNPKNGGSGLCFCTLPSMCNITY